MVFTKVNLVAAWGMLSGDSEEDTHLYALEWVFYVYTIMVQQKGQIPVWA